MLGINKCKGSYPNTWSSHGPFKWHGPLAPPVRVTLTHTNSCNQICIVYLSLLHVVFKGFEAYQPYRRYVSHAPKFIYPATVIIIRKVVNKCIAYIHHVIIHTCFKLGALAQYTTISNVKHIHVQMSQHTTHTRVRHHHHPHHRRESAT